MIPGLACLIIPVGLVGLFIWLATRWGKTTSPFVSTSPQVHPRPIPTQTIRKVADGFWINSSLAAGTPIDLRYAVNGETIEQTLIYQPGPEGQFVYTGTMPDKVTVSGTGALPPALSLAPLLFANRDETVSTASSRPTMFPPAY